MVLNDVKVSEVKVVHKWPYIFIKGAIKLHALTINKHQTMNNMELSHQENTAVICGKKIWLKCIMHDNNSLCQVELVVA